MRSTLLSFTIVALATIVIGVSMREAPYFPGDLAAARWVQSQSAGTAWAIAVSQLATSPMKYFAIGLAIGLSFALAGWRGAVLAAGAIAFDQYVADSTKALVARPRPTPLLVSVVGSPTGFSFPSTTMTFFSATFGLVAILAARTKTTSFRWPLVVVSMALVIAGCAARVALGAHWPSDVIFTVALSMGWIWATSRAML